MFVDEKKEGEAVAKLNEPWRVALLKAAQLIRERGHCKGAYTDAAGSGALCTIGAISLTITGFEAPPYIYKKSLLGEAHIGRCDLYDKVVTQIVRHGKISSIPAWNDAPERTADDVINLLERVAHS